MKEAYGSHVARVRIVGLLCIISLLVAVSIADDAAIRLVFGPPPAPPPPPPPVKQGVAAITAAVAQWLQGVTVPYHRTGTRLPEKRRKRTSERVRVFNLASSQPHFRQQNL